jgi:hypothetical protein
MNQKQTRMNQKQTRTTVKKPSHGRIAIFLAE